MKNILSMIANQSSRFMPNNLREYLALQIAKKLGDQSAFRQYLVLFEHYPEELLLKIFRKCSAEGRLTGGDFLRIFRQLTIEET